MNRRLFLYSAGVSIGSHSLPGGLYAANRPEPQQRAGEPDHRLRITPCTLGLGNGVTIRTLAYNGQVPGPVLQLREGRKLTIDITNTGPERCLIQWKQILSLIIRAIVLLLCHQQLHMDYGFMTMIRYSA